MPGANGQARQQLLAQEAVTDVGIAEYSSHPEQSYPACHLCTKLVGIAQPTQQCKTEEGHRVPSTCSAELCC